MYNSNIKPDFEVEEIIRGNGQVKEQHEGTIAKLQDVTPHLLKLDICFGTTVRLDLTELALACFYCASQKKK